MNISIAKQRMSEVLAVDSISSTQFDFLATHVPFRKITLKVGKNGANENMSEDAVYDKLFSTEGMNHHQLIIVEGSSGAGKSHFIRWIHAKISEYENEVVLLIRRSDNTLKGTIRQLLAIDEIKSIANKEAYERLVRANQTISDQKFKNEIYHSILVEIESDEREDGPSSSEKKKLIALLSNDMFKKRLFKVNGPIDRIFSKVSSAEMTGSQDIEAKFETADFNVGVDFVEEMENNGADRRAVSMANKLISEDTNYVVKITDYVNSFIDDVVRSCAGIETGDFQQMFKEIRQELYRQHKSLILLVEDITSFTGINKELLDALRTEHTGMNASDNMCRLISVVGTTTQYYEEFRDNYKDRITSQITINDGAIGENADDLVQFVARYLNAVSVKREELESWQKNGALLSEMPIHNDDNSKVWGYYNLDGRKMSLYPFTRNAVVQLFRAMPNAKTPRYIIRNIIEPGINEIIASPKEYPAFCSSWHSPMNEINKEAELNQLISSVNELIVSDNDKAKIRSRLSALIGFWGDSTLKLIANGALAGLDKKIYEQLGLDDVYLILTKNKKPAAILENTTSASDVKVNVSVSTEPSSPIDKEAEKRNQKYISFRQCVLKWHNEKTKLVSFQSIRDSICDFAFDTINWQQNGIPLALVETMKSGSCRLFGFERQDQGLDKALITLSDNDETYRLLLCFGKWEYLGEKSWNYSESVSDVYFATMWLEKHRKEIVSVVLGTVDNGIPVYAKAEMLLELYRKVFNASVKAAKISALDKEDFISGFDKKKTEISTNNGYTPEWCAVLDLLYTNYPELKSDFVNKYFNLIMGSDLNTRKMIFNRSLFTKTLKSLKDSEFSVELGENAADRKIKTKYDQIEFCQKIIKKSEQAAKSMYDLGKSVREQILKQLGYDNDDFELDPEPGDIRTMLDKIAEFYESAIHTGVNIAPRKDDATELKKHADEISKAMKSLNFVYKERKIPEILLVFADNPIKKLLPLRDLMIHVSTECEKVISTLNSEKDKLARSGKWEGEVDSRFEQNSERFDNIYKRLGV